MMEMVEAEFAPAKESVDWADEAIEEFHLAAGKFFNPDAAIVITEFDPDSGENVQKVRLKSPLPKTLRRKATEALVTLRHSFDQATFAARNLTGRRSNTGVNYPWSSGPTDTERLLEARGIDKRLWDVFVSHEPYPRTDTHPGGDDLIRTLATIANKKHTVGLTIGAQPEGWGGGGFRGQSIHSLKIMNRWDPVKNELEFLRWIGDVQFDGDQTVYFQVLFKDSRLPDRVAVRPALETFSAKAKAVIESLQSRCEELAN